MLNMRTMKQFAALLKPSSTGAGTDSHVSLDPSDISVAPAEPADMPAMVAVLYAALQADVFHHAVFSEETGRRHLQYRRELCQISLEHDINQPGTHLLVAKNTKTGEVLGFSGFREDAGRDDGPRTTGFLPYGELTNIRIRTFLDRLHDIHRKHLTDPHLVCSYLYVLSQYQGQGVGTRLLRYALDQLKLGQRCIYLRTPVANREIFLHQGWREVDTYDVDLAEWAGKLSGYGMYRTSILVRDSSGLDTTVENY